MRPLARLTCCGVAALYLLGSAPTGATISQGAAEPQQPTFRAVTNLVEVDVTALDGRGNFVPGLLPEDLALYEDGKRQKIELFYLVAHDPAAGLKPAAGQDGQLSTDRTRRIFVIMFDEAHLTVEGLMRAKKGAEQFVRDQMVPGDVGGVFAAGTMINGRLTTDRRELAAAVHQVQTGFENRQEILAPFSEWPIIPSELDALRIAEGAREVVDRIGADACVQEPQLCQFAGGVNQVEDMIQKKARLYIRQARMLTVRTVQNLRYVASNLSRLPGRKTVVFISDGFFVEESRSDLEALAAQAARADTVIYSIDGRGLIAGRLPPDAGSRFSQRSIAFDSGDDGPLILASGTGGMRIHDIDDVSKALGIVARDTSNYYVIGYEPTNPVMDGKFRKIEVKAVSPGLHLRARKGYAALELPPTAHITKIGGQ
jgi:VWFA-related protein